MVKVLKNKIIGKYPNESLNMFYSYSIHIVFAFIFLSLIDDGDGGTADSLTRRRLQISAMTSQLFRRDNLSFRRMPASYMMRRVSEDADLRAITFSIDVSRLVSDSRLRHRFSAFFALLSSKNIRRSSYLFSSLGILPIQAFNGITTQ